MTGALTLGTDLKIADSQLQALIGRGAIRLVLDLTGVPYSESSSLGMLVHTCGLTRQHGGTLRLCGLPERIGDTLKLTTTDTLLPIDADRAASIGALL